MRPNGSDVTTAGNHAIIFSICSLLVPQRLVLGTLVQGPSHPIYEDAMTMVKVNGENGMEMS